MLGTYFYLFLRISNESKIVSFEQDLCLRVWNFSGAQEVIAEYLKILNVQSIGFITNNFQGIIIPNTMRGHSRQPHQYGRGNVLRS